MRDILRSYPHLMSCAALTLALAWSGCASKKQAPNASPATEEEARQAALASEPPREAGGAKRAPAPEADTTPEEAAPGEPVEEALDDDPGRPTIGRKQSTKAQAPVTDVELVSSGEAGAVEVTLSFEATEDIPRAVARIVVPEGAEHLSGPLERDLGAVSRGERHTLTATFELPAQGQHLIAGGVDCHVTDGVQLHGGTTLRVGRAPKPAPKPRVVEDDALGGVRLGGAR